MTANTSLEDYFARFRRNIIGNEQTFLSPFGEKKIIYADWTASGRAYQPIEDRIQKEILPFIGNTHTGTTITGTLMSGAYEEAKGIIKQHVGADKDDVLLFCGSGMTAAVNKLQRILGIRIPERSQDYQPLRRCKSNTLCLNGCLKPVVFITHMEHHSNHISWLETIADVEIIQPGKDGNVNLDHLKELLQQYQHRKNKFAAVTACSNVTGIQTPYHTIARFMHEQGGFCFVDFACSAPYVEMNMHPDEESEQLDAIYFSPHKFLGGVGTPGVLLFNKKLYRNMIPDHPGGGTVVYSNPWKAHDYVNGIEQREDGGTPPFLGAIKAAMCVRLKERMGIENIRFREQELLGIIFNRLSKMNDIIALEATYRDRLGIVSLLIKDAHYNLIVKMLNDRFGIQARGGCSCAGTYGHHLLNVDETKSKEIRNRIQSGDRSCKPGWVRLSVHPTMTDREIHFMTDAIELIASFYQDWKKEYSYCSKRNEYSFAGFIGNEKERIEAWFLSQSLICY